MRVDLNRLKPDKDRAKHDPGEAGANLPNKEKRDNGKHIHFDTVLSKLLHFLREICEKSETETR